MRGLSCVAVIMATAITIGYGQGRTLDFSSDAVGQAPSGFEFGHTANEGRAGRWVVRAEGGNHYLAQVDTDRTRSRFPIAVVAGFHGADVDLSVRFRPVSGGIDQAAGLVWRYQNQDNYYVVRANALENNVVLYKVQNGQRIDLAVKGEGRTYGKPSTVPTGRWGRLRIVARGPLFAVYHDGRKLYEVEDSTFRQAGKVGVWTKADSVTDFDDLSFVAVK
jgi:hypothetical protein